MNDFLVQWKASIDEANNNFRLFYAMTEIPSNIADLSIKLIEAWIINLITYVLNMKISDVFGTDDLMKMTIKSMLFIIVYR